MSEGKSVKDLLNKLTTFLQGLGKPKETSALRPTPSGANMEDTIPPVSARMAAEKLARISNNRLTPLTEKEAPGREQWQKLKQSAKANDHGETSLDHWNQKQGGIMSGTTFDAATTDISNGVKPRKRPSVMNQARITSNRLQALQASMEKATDNEIDKHDEED